MGFQAERPRALRACQGRRRGSDMTTGHGTGGAASPPIHIPKSDVHRDDDDSDDSDERCDSLTEYREYLFWRRMSSKDGRSDSFPSPEDQPRPRPHRSRSDPTHRVSFDFAAAAPASAAVDASLMFSMEEL